MMRKGPDFLVLLIITLAKMVCGLPVTTDGCDWTGSGLEHGENSRSVRPVYLRCTQGHVEWRYPRGGLRVVFHRPYDFRLCIKGHEAFKGARVYVEGHGELYPFLWKGDGKDQSLPRCWTTTKGQIALYVEAETVHPSSFGLSTDVASFSYDLQKKKEGDLYDDMAECRPCSEEEMLRAFCNSDFVARGKILDINNNEHLERSELKIKVSKIYHQTQDVFTSQNNILHSVLTGNVHMPLKCHPKTSQEDYVVMGRMKLGEPVLQCAPTLREWTKVRRKASKEGTAQCVMET